MLPDHGDASDGDGDDDDDDRDHHDDDDDDGGADDDGDISFIATCAVKRSRRPRSHGCPSRTLKSAARGICIMTATALIPWGSRAPLSEDVQRARLRLRT